MGLITYNSWGVCFWFQWNHNIFNHAGVHMYVCVCMRVRICLGTYLVNIFQEGKIVQISYLICGCTWLRKIGAKEAHLVKVEGHVARSTGSSNENHVNTISQWGKLVQISYVVCGWTLLSTRNIRFLVEVKAELGSTRPGQVVKLICKHRISRDMKFA